LKHYGVGLYDNPARTSAYKGKILIRLQRFSDGGITGYLVRDPRPEEERNGKPKYILPTNYFKQLDVFGAYQLKEQIPLRVLYVVESPFSVMHFHQLGSPTVAILGWTMSPRQIEIVSSMAKGIVFLPDSDKRIEASQYLRQLAANNWVKLPEMPKPDPELLSAEEIRSLT